MPRGPLDDRRREVRDAGGLQLAQVAQQCARRADRDRVLGAQAEPLERRTRRTGGGARRAARAGSNSQPSRSVRSTPSMSTPADPSCDAPSEQEFPRREPSQDRSGIGRGHRGESQLASREITPGDPEHALRFGSHSSISGRGRHDRDGTEEVVADGLQQLVGERRTRRDRLDDLATHDPLGELGVLDLIAERDAEALLDQPADVLVHGLDGDAGEGNRRGRRHCSATSASARAPATPPPRPRRTSRRSRPCGTAGSRPGAGI